MQIFVTGSESFIGKVLIEECQRQGWRVSGVDVSARAASTAAGESSCAHRLAETAAAGFSVADVRSADIADLIPQGTEVVIHLAAVSRDVDCRHDTPRAYDINVVGTSRMAEAAWQKGVPHFVFASSEWVYGSNADGQPQLEDMPLDLQRLHSEYALSKLMGEQVLRIAHQRKWFSSLSILRFGIVYGPRPANWSAVESIFHDICCRREIRLGSRQTARRFIEVRDVADGILASCHSTGCQTFNLSGDQLITLGDIAEQGFRTVGYELPIHEADPDNVNIRNPDNGKMRNLLGWRPRIDLETGLQQLHQYFQQQQLIECTA